MFRRNILPQCSGQKNTSSAIWEGGRKRGWFICSYLEDGCRTFLLKQLWADQERFRSFCTQGREHHIFMQEGLIKDKKNNGSGHELRRTAFDLGARVSEIDTKEH
jgi:hypothetical protein